MVQTKRVFKGLKCRASLVVLGLVLAPMLSGSAQDTQTVHTKSVNASVPRRASHYQPSHFPKRASMYYQTIWGVDSLSVKSTESGKLIRFSYRVLDASKAKVFNDVKVEADLIAPSRGVKLVVPQLEKVGLLRQRNTPEDGVKYWMAFSNPRLTVKPGDRVNIVIGQFHAIGLVVE